MSESQPALDERKGTGVSVEQFTSQFASFSKEIVRSMKEVSELADKRASTFLLTLGTVLLFLTMFWRLRPFGAQVSNLEASEFITMAIVSALFVLAGSLMRLYQQWLMSAVDKELQATGNKLLERNHETAARLAQSGMEHEKKGDVL